MNSMKHINTITLTKQTRRGTYMFNHATIPHTHEEWMGRRLQTGWDWSEIS